MARNLAELLPAFFVGPNGQPLTQDQVRARQAVANSLLQKATDTSPNAGGWASILAKGVQGFAAGRERNMADAGAEAATKADADLSSALLSSFGGGGATSPIPMTDANAQIAATSPSTLPSGDQADYIRNGLIQRGFSPQVSDAFLANFQDESGLNSGVNEANPIVAGSRGGYGLYQLTGPRRVAYESFAKDRGVDPSNIDAQLDFLKYEVNGPEAAAAQTFMNAPDTATAAQAIVNNFLRPAPEHRQERSARYASLPSVQTAPVAPVEVASISPLTATDASPIGQMQTVSAPTVAPQQDISPVAQALTAPVKGDRLGATTMQNFNDRFGSPTETASPVFDIPSATQAPVPAPVEPAAQAIPAQAASVPAALSRQPVALPELPQIPPPQPLNPAVVKALSSPYASDNTKRVASMLLEQNQQQREAYQKQVLARQTQQQEIARRQAIAQANGIDPNYAADDELWKGAVGNVFAAPSVTTINGVAYDNRTHQPIFGSPEKPTSIQEFEYGQQNPGYVQQQIDLRRSSANNTTINNGEGNKFYNTLDEKNAATFSGLSDTGMQARSNLAQVTQLGELLKNTPTGATAALTQVAGEYGIPVKGVEDVQAVQSLISRLVPAQRQPGSGSMSDQDLALFKQSLPRLINQPGGNATIINTLKAISQYQIDQGAIADRVANREITPADGRKAIANLPNPLSGFKAPAEGKEKEGWSNVPAQIPGVTIRRKN